jgi:TonB family protein
MKKLRYSSLLCIFCLGVSPARPGDTGPSSGYTKEFQNQELVAASIESQRPDAFPEAKPVGKPAWNPKKPGYTVIVDVKLNEYGQCESTSIHASDDLSNGQILNAIALKLAAGFKQEPKLKNGQPVKSVARVPFFFPVAHDEGPDANLAPRPKVLSGAPVAYPPALAAQRENGGAIVELHISKEGKVDRVVVLEESNPLFGAAVTTAAQTWHFEPAKQEGLLVKSRWRIAVEFNADGNLGDYKWRIAPRPNLGSYTVTPPGFSGGARGSEPRGK